MSRWLSVPLRLAVAGLKTRRILLLATLPLRGELIPEAEAHHCGLYWGGFGAKITTTKLVVRCGGTFVSHGLKYLRAISVLPSLTALKVQT